MAASAEGGHRAALAAVGAERIAALSRTSDAPGLIRLASHLGLLALIAEIEHALKSTAQGYLDAHHQILLAIDARR